MARPKKCKRICSIPDIGKFVPDNGETQAKAITMTLEEYQCIRLIDYKDASQEECAISMNVARTTVTAMYDSARKKLAKCLVEGNILYIEGGNYVVCDKSAECAGSKPCCERNHG
ncbi:Predicted DNA-binding protein, UPF0251 family [Acetitomaculum ruminis DSM 5522]|uniref:Predicted DNA-binding protein, UPF0251 family n=1 Tax=Acetitomaculum ruminis DSM 5522 TaxID=1120918 RepID=A0A1I1A6V8_9FIRM|nr:DUF134 domain-containing protein [Acetitomaculum ruminis]SFB33691.1 Predicted DNA-binding protein, UPF0251 family [Acetitomaculum ruminis DSM 5522]